MLNFNACTAVCKISKNFLWTVPLLNIKLKIYFVTQNMLLKMRCIVFVCAWVMLEGQVKSELVIHSYCYVNIIIQIRSFPHHYKHVRTTFNITHKIIKNGKYTKNNITFY